MPELEQSIIYGPGKIYRAPAGQAQPAVNVDPVGVGWTELSPYDGELVKRWTQSINKYRHSGSTLPVKGRRTEEDVEFEFSVPRASAATFALALNNRTLTTTAAATGVPGYVEMGMTQGWTISRFALLFRNESPEMEGGNEQYYIPQAFQSDDIERTLSNEDPELIGFKVSAFYDPTLGDVGKYRAQTAAPL